MSLREEIIEDLREDGKVVYASELSVVSNLPEQPKPLSESDQEIFELVLKTDLDTAFPTAVLFNSEELKKASEKFIAQYEGYVVTEDALPKARKDRANINKVINQIKKTNTLVRQRALQPVEEFKSKTKEITDVLEQPLQLITEQIAQADENFVKERFKKYSEYYVKNYLELSKILPLERVIHLQWENRSQSDTSIITSIDENANKFTSELNLIKSYGEVYGDQLQKIYIDTGDFGKVATKKSEIDQVLQVQKEMEEKKKREQEKEEERKKLEEEKRKEEEAEKERQRLIAEHEQEKARIEKEAYEKAKQEMELQNQENKVEELETMASALDDREDDTQPKVNTYELRIFATSDQAKDFSKYLKENQIKYTKI